MSIFSFFWKPLPKIRPSLTIEDFPAPVKPAEEDLMTGLKKAVELVDLDEAVSDPAIGCLYLTLYTETSDDLVRERVSPINHRNLVAVSLYSYFKNSNLTPTLTMERLIKITYPVNLSGYAKHDITVITENLLQLPERWHRQT